MFIPAAAATAVVVVVVVVVVGVVGCLFLSRFLRCDVYWLWYFSGGVECNQGSRDVGLMTSIDFSSGGMFGRNSSGILVFPSSSLSSSSSVDRLFVVWIGEGGELLWRRILERILAGSWINRARCLMAKNLAGISRNLNYLGIPSSGGEGEGRICDGSQELGS